MWCRRCFAAHICPTPFPYPSMFHCTAVQQVIQHVCNAVAINAAHHHWGAQLHSYPPPPGVHKPAHMRGRQRVLSCSCLRLVLADTTHTVSPHAPEPRECGQKGPAHARKARSTGNPNMAHRMHTMTRPQQLCTVRPVTSVTWR